MIKFAILEATNKIVTLMKDDSFICFYPFKENEILLKRNYTRGN